MTTILLGGAGKSEIPIYSASLQVQEWEGTNETGYTQTTTCEGMTQEIVCQPPYIKPTGNKDTDIKARLSLSYIDVIDTGNQQITATCYSNKPETDIIIYLIPTNFSN